MIFFVLCSSILYCSDKSRGIKPAERSITKPFGRKCCDQYVSMILTLNETETQSLKKYNEAIKLRNETALKKKKGPNKTCNKKMGPLRRPASKEARGLTDDDFPPLVRPCCDPFILILRKMQRHAVMLETLHNEIVKETDQLRRELGESLK